MEIKTIINDILNQLNETGSLMEEAEGRLNDTDLEGFASKLVIASKALEEALELYETNAQKITENDIDEIGSLVEALDNSEDEILQKQASVLEELLLTVCADPKAQGAFKKAQEEEIEKIRKKYIDSRGDVEYKDTKVALKEQIKANEAIKAIDERIKRYRPLEAPLNTRYCPDMPGVPLVRVGDGVFQCPITKKIYDFRTGYTTMKGNKVPGTDVLNQTQDLGNMAQENVSFSTREELMNG